MQGQGSALGIGRGGAAGSNLPMTSMPQGLNPPAYIGGSPSSKSQFVKQELRDVVSRRMPQTSQAGGIAQQIVEQIPTNFDTDGELPIDIIESRKRYTFVRLRLFIGQYEWVVV